MRGCVAVTLVLSAFGFTSLAIANEESHEDNIVAIACQFENLPLMLLVDRDGMGGENNTLQVGTASPVPLSIGSSLMSASFQGQSYTFSLRIPSNVTISSYGSNSITYHGECVSSLVPR